MRLLRTLVDCDKGYTEAALPQELRELYDRDLHFRTSPAVRPFVIANFVSTLDGVVSYRIKDKSVGATITGSDPADRFIMGLLRASADAVMKIPQPALGPTDSQCYIRRLRVRAP